MSFAIDATNLGRKFGNKYAVKDLSLQVNEGEIYGFLGPNGAGKSTTMKMLVTLLAPNEGDAHIMGKSVLHNADEVRLLIGVALQEASLDLSQTGLELLQLQGRLYGLSNNVINERIKTLIKLIDIGDALKKQIKTYSGGMKRRLDLATAIIHNPQVLFLDEPTTGLDPVSRAKVWDEVNRLNKELGMTIFLTTQYLEEADKLADKIGIINEGKLAVEGTPSALRKSIGQDVIIAQIENMKDDTVENLKKIKGVDKVDVHGNEVSVSTKDGSAIIGNVAIELNKQNVKIESLTLRTTTLDDVFLEVTGNRLNDQKEQIS